MTASLACLAAAVLTRRAGLVCVALAVAVAPGFGVLRRVKGEDQNAVSNAAFAVIASLRLWEMTLLGTFDAELRRVVGEEPQAPEAEPPPDSPLPRPNMVTDHTLH